MAVTIPPLPSDASHDWYAHYVAMDLAIRELQGIVATLAPASGFIASINGTIVPDNAGNVVLAASDVNAMSSGYSPGIADMPPTVPDYIDKDPVTGFWPAGWNTDGTPIYTGGAVDHGVRCHARATPVIWRGAEPSPDPVASGTGGMLQGMDERAINVP